jgi:type I restriction enzyme R subunit
MKAQVVAYDRDHVVLYEQELNRLIAERGLDLTTQVVMTVGGKDDKQEWKTYELTRAQEAVVKREFNKVGQPPTFLVVTAKLLTGFDAPIEQVMYLDRPLTRHTLFQAITRTNRRFTNPVTGQEKHNGLVVDYIGLQAPGGCGRTDPRVPSPARPDLSTVRGHRPGGLLLRGAHGRDGAHQGAGAEGAVLAGLHGCADPVGVARPSG